MLELGCERQRAGQRGDPLEIEEYRARMLRLALQAGRGLKLQGDYEGGRTLLEKAGAYCPSQELVVERGYLELLCGQTASALASFELAFEMESTEQALLALLAGRLESYDWQEAARLLEQHEQLISQPFKFNFLTAKTLLRKVMSEALQEGWGSGSEELREAGRMLRECLSDRIADKSCLLEIHELLGDVELFGRLYQSAEKLYLKAKTLFYACKQQVPPDRMAEVSASLANAYFLQHRYQLSLEEYQFALKWVSPQNTRFRKYIMGNVGLVRLEQGDTQQGREVINFVLKDLSTTEKKENLNYAFLVHSLARLEAQPPRPLCQF